MPLELGEVHKRLIAAAEEIGFVSDNANVLLERVAEDLVEHPSNQEEESDEAIIQLTNGGTLRSGPSDDDADAYAYGGYVRVCDPDGNEILYWDRQEWVDEPVLVMGAIFGAAIKSIAELTADRKLEDGYWVFDKDKANVDRS